MSAEIYSFKKHGVTERIPVFITHDQQPGRVIISKGLMFKSVDESWLNYCSRLWRGVYEENYRDNIKITVHLKISESDRMMMELNQWAFYASRIDAGALIDEVNRRFSNIEIHGILFKFDLPE